MALKKRDDGEYAIKTFADAQQALELALQIEDEIMDDYNDMKQLKSSVARWMDRNDTKRITSGKEGSPMEGRYATVIVRSRRKWNADKLKSALKEISARDWKHLWQHCTVRVPDADKIDQAVKRGLIELEDISEALEETKDAPFIQVYDEK